MIDERNDFAKTFLSFFTWSVLHYLDQGRIVTLVSLQRVIALLPTIEIILIRKSTPQSHSLASGGMTPTRIISIVDTSGRSSLHKDTEVIEPS